MRRVVWGPVGVQLGSLWLAMQGGRLSRSWHSKLGASLSQMMLMSHDALAIVTVVAMAVVAASIVGRSSRRRVDVGFVDAWSVVVEGQFGLDMVSLGMVDIGLMCSGTLDQDRVGSDMAD
jgi:hypothetical protein